MHRVFILSPANPAGRRAALLFSERAAFPLAQALQRGETRPLGEIFQFLSGLYFRGKLAYARTFARPPPGQPGCLVITSHRGLVASETPTSLADLRAFAAVPIDPLEPRYRAPLLTTTTRMDSMDTEFVLLGSISTEKYVEPLLSVLGERLLFPSDFVGRGDMSRGGLLLRCVRDARELEYRPVANAVRRGKRPPRLPRSG